MRLVSVVVASAIVAGCSSAGVPQELAQRLAAYTAQVKVIDAGYARVRDDLAAARRSVVEQVNADAAAAEARTGRFADTWRLAGDEQRLKIVETVRKASVPVAVPTDVPPVTPVAVPDTAAVAAAKARAQKLDASAKALAQLAEGPSLTENLKFYEAFFKSVADAVKQARDREKQQTDQAKQAVTTKAKAVAESEKTAQEKAKKQ